MVSNNDDDFTPSVETWPNRPLLFQADTTQCPDLSIQSHHGPTTTTIPIGNVFSFESNLFQGKGLFRIRNTTTTNNNNSSSSSSSSSHDYFVNKKRKYQFVIQGKFKKEISVTDVISGRLYEKELSTKPPLFVSRLLQKLLSKVAPGVEMDLNSHQPKVLAPFSDCIQILSADKEGTEPNIIDTILVENNSSFFNGTNVSSKERKKLFSTPTTNKKKKKKRQEEEEQKSPSFVFDTTTVYTFEQYDDFIDYSTYHLDIKICSVDMSKIVNGQPFQFNAMMKSTGSYLWLFQIWHENLLSSTKQNENEPTEKKE